MDVVTYALCKKLISSSATGISSITVTEDGDLLFTMADGKEILVDMPIKTDCINVKYIDTLPISNISSTTIYIQKTNIKDGEGNFIYRQYMWVNEIWKFIGVSGEPIATVESVGLVKPDGESILIDEEGTISVDIEHVHEVIDELIQDNEGLVDKNDIDEFFK